MLTRLVSGCVLILVGFFAMAVVRRGSLVEALTAGTLLALPWAIICVRRERRRLP